MKIQLFGKSLFEITKSKSDALWAEATSPKARESKHLPDFNKNRNGGLDSFSNYIAITAVRENKNDTTKKVKAADKPLDIKITPKGVYEMKMLNDLTFKLNTDPEYVDKQLGDFKEKLGLIKTEEWDVRNGVDELTSIVMRLENRKKYPDVKDFFEQYPYTTSSKIGDLVKVHDHLKLGEVAQFIADMPAEAIDVMKKYNEFTDKVCGKQAVFYIIADKKDFKKTDTRRDPILLAQSPFGHFWQILGAWDEEMMFLEEL